MLEVIPSRIFNFLYVYIDIVWLVALLIILICAKRYLAVFAGLIGSLIYFIVDYGIFYHALGTRVIEGADPLTLLLWLSISYGFTNFAWIWLWLDRDKRSLEWSVLIIFGWLATALLSQNFGSNFHAIYIQRGTNSYHGIMALILLIGYAILIVKNNRGNPGHNGKIKIFWILSIGILVQFSWEAVLLINGIRAIGIMPLIINSLVETNMGLPYIFLIHRVVTSKRNEDLSPKV